MATSSRNNLAIILAVLLGSSSLTACGDRRPLWSIEGGAIDGLELDDELAFVPELPTEWPDPGCQMVISTRADETVPNPGSDSDEWRSWLDDADATDVRCAGQCADGSKCLLHYSVELMNEESAETRCACKPQDTPPCALTVEWGLGKKSQRSIRRVWCASASESNSRCQVILVGAGKQLDVTCTAAL